ncbi:MAG TPA: M48 family metallopeptidase, partial [Pirellulaceae bacterium]
RFQFNRTSPRTFVLDRVKELFLTVLLMAPLLLLVLWVFETWGGYAWLISWGFFVAFTLLVTYVAPLWILPLFYRFQPLPDGDLKSAIQRMAEQCRFPLREVYQIDGSTRSTKTNAFFTGLGKNKRIALFDTLIHKHTVPELVCVLAHEIGHYRRKHILKLMVIGFAESGLLFFLAGLFLKHRELSNAFGVRDVSVYTSLVFFSILFTPLSRVLGIATLGLQRRHEFEADAFAAEVTGDPGSLVAGLKKLAQDNLTNLTPHPLYVFLNYSHPPIPERLAALASSTRTKG